MVCLFQKVGDLSTLSPQCHLTCLSLSFSLWANHFERRKEEKEKEKEKKERKEEKGKEEREGKSIFSFLPTLIISLFLNKFLTLSLIAAHEREGNKRESKYKKERREK